MAKRSRKLLCVFFALIVLVVAGEGCGGGAGSSGRTGSSVKTATDGSSGFSAATKDGQRVLAFGVEASEADRAAASAVVEEDLVAVATAHFGKQCSLLGAELLKQVIEQSRESNSPRPTCANELRRLAEPLSQSRKVRADPLEGEIDALRRRGDNAYALFHGKDHLDHVMPLTKEGKRWKIDSLLAGILR